MWNMHYPCLILAYFKQELKCGCIAIDLNFFQTKITIYYYYYGFINVFNTKQQWRYL
jgi:hypothetical protein